MQEIEADLWSIPDADVICITTNCTVTEAGNNVMGGGCAREAADKFPSLPSLYGTLIKDHGANVVFLRDASPTIVAFPVKWEVWEKADPKLIESSCIQLEQLATDYNWGKVLVPRPGAGLGGLNWEKDVKPICEKYFDYRFVIVDYPKGK